MPTRLCCVLCCVLQRFSQSLRFKELVPTEPLTDFSAAIPAPELDLRVPLRVYGLQLFTNEGVSDSLREKAIYVSL